MNMCPRYAVLPGLLVTLMAPVSPGHPQHPPTSADRVTASASGIVGIKHVGIPVRSQDHALAFYTDVLGFAVVVDEPMGSGPRWIELAIPESPTRVLLLAGPDVADHIGAFTNIVFLSRDVQTSYDSLRARGVAFGMPPTALPGGGMNAVFRDPDGNTFALATPDRTDAPLPPGVWSAVLREADGRSLSFPAEVADDDGTIRITFVIQSSRFPTTDVRVSTTGVRFIWDLSPGPLVACTLARTADDVFVGDCVDRGDGDVKRLTLRPPNP